MLEPEDELLDDELLELDEELLEEELLELDEELLEDELLDPPEELGSPPPQPASSKPSASMGDIFIDTMRS